MQSIILLLKKAYIRGKEIVLLIRPAIDYWFLYFLPNLARIVGKKISAGKNISVNQIIICRGDGSVAIGNNCSFGYRLGGFHKGGSIELQARYRESDILIRDNVFFNNNVLLCAAEKIEIGSDTLIGQNVTIMDFDAHGVNPSKRKQLGEKGQVVLGKNVWVGNNVVILKNTTIGDNSIVAAGAVVTGNFPENVIIGGVPAKIIKQIDV